MSMKRFSEGINDADRRIFRLWKIIGSEGRHALHCVFKWGCKKEPTESLEHYLKVTKGMENKDYKKWFDKMMRDAIKENPSGESYDVSLLHSCLKWGCDLGGGPWEEGHDNLESLCTTVKNYRNRLVHQDKIKDDADMKKWCQEIKEVLEKLLRSAGNKCGIPNPEVESIINEINEQIKQIMSAPLGDYACFYLHKEMLDFREKVKKAIYEDGKNELSEQYKNMSKIDPASFVTRRERLYIKNVFTKLEVVCENMDETHDVEYNELLDMRTEGENRPTITILEGDAGAGKSTLTKLILSDWSEGSIFKGLNNYDLVLLGEGKNKNISSYLELIQVLMPKVSQIYSDNELVRAVLQLKVLLVMDGFDELNAESEKFFKELLDKQIQKSGGKLHLLITTRPSKLPDLFSMLTSHSRVQTKLKGISVDKRVEFVSRLHDEMIKEKLSKQDTQKLIDFMKQSQSRLGEHYRLPLNLTLLTYLWASDPGKVNSETTATGLYIAFLELFQSRLLVRLQEQKGVTKLPKDKCEVAINDFLKELYSVSLKTLSSDSMQLSDKSAKALREKCEQLKLPFNDMTEAFLAVEKEWTSKGYKMDLTVPHKSLLEFYAANQFIKYIKNKNDKPSFSEFRSTLGMHVPKEEIEKIMNMISEASRCEEAKSLKHICHQEDLDTDHDLTKYENMFLHLTGLLAHQCPYSLQEFSEELVEILKNAGFKGTRWLDFLVEAMCDDKLASLIATLSSDQLTVRDGHTGAALVLFKNLETNTPVQIILENEVSYIPHLDEMLLQLSKRNCDVQLLLKHQWKHKEYGFSDKLLNNLLSGGDEDRCRVSRFTGHLETLSHLPETLKNLRITFASTEHAKKLLEELAELKERNDIEYIGIHVMSEVMATGLSPLPIVKNVNRECGTLWLSKVTDDWKDKCNVIRALLPEEGMFNSIMFPQSNFSMSQCEGIIKELKELGVKVGMKGGIRLSSSTIMKEQLPELRKFAKKTMDCILYCSDESSMW